MTTRAGGDRVLVVLAVPPVGTAPGAWHERTILANIGGSIYFVLTQGNEIQVVDFANDFIALGQIPRQPRDLAVDLPRGIARGDVHEIEEDFSPMWTEAEINGEIDDAQGIAEGGTSAARH